jgi:hypothetical protein
MVVVDQLAKLLGNGQLSRLPRIAPVVKLSFWRFACQQFLVEALADQAAQFFRPRGSERAARGVAW